MYKTEGRDGSGNNNNNGGGTGKVAHTCIICEMVYSSTNALLAHMRSAHEALMDFSGSVIEIYVSMMNEKANQDSNGSSSPLATKRGRSSLPVRRPNPSMTSFLIYYPCCLCKGVFRSPGHRERHAWACEGRIRLPRRPRSSVSVPPVPPSSYVRAVHRKAALNLNQSLQLRDTPLRKSNRKRSHSRPSETERNKTVMKHPVSPDDSVCREFNLNRRWRHEDDDEDNASFNTSTGKLHRSYT